MPSDLRVSTQTPTTLARNTAPSAASLPTSAPEAAPVAAASTQWGQRAPTWNLGIDQTTIVPTSLPPARNAREQSVDKIPLEELRLDADSRSRMKKGERTLALRQPIVKGSYTLVADYTDKGANHLYLIDKRDGLPVARYVSDGGKSGNTVGGKQRFDKLYLRPTWTPTPNELRSNPGYRGDGPGPEGSMGVAKLHFHGNMFLHGISDAETDGSEVSSGTDSLSALGQPGSYGCWEMSNPNMVELVERFGIGEGTEFTVLKGPGAKADAKRLAQQMDEQKLGDRPVSAGTDLLVTDFQGAGKYVSQRPYTDRTGTKQTDDGWWVRLWQRRQMAGV